MNENPTDANAQNNLGTMYKEGDGVPKDLKKAAYWFTKAAEQGHVYAQANLAVCYWDGDGVPKDLKKAAYWFTKAAEQGNAPAQNNLGIFYKRGEGVPRDLEKAKYWYTQAADQGHAGAQRNLSLLYSSGSSGGGCYIATCVYGSYDCSQVWTLRRYRDIKLSASWLGRRFIQIYYAVSPKIVELCGNKMWFNKLFKPVLNKIVHILQNSGIDSGFYSGR